jgi:hypothetical protein
VSALRWLLIGIPTNLALDTGVLVGATVAGITVASLLLPGWPAETAKQGSTSRAIGPGMPGGVHTQLGVCPEWDWVGNDLWAKGSKCC